MRKTLFAVNKLTTSHKSKSMEGNMKGHLFRSISVAVLILVVFAPATVSARPVTRSFYLGVSPPGGPPVEGPDVAMAKDGSTIAIMGSGTFTIHGGRPTLTGSGVY